MGFGSKRADSIFHIQLQDRLEPIMDILPIMPHFDPQFMRINIILLVSG